jgi:phosphoribosylanthranilate isomerase
MTQIKICGITNIADALAATECGADALGFIFYKDSPRYVTPEQASAVSRALSQHMVRVGVFVNANLSNIIEIVDMCKIDMIQLHGDELPSDCRRFPAVRVIKAVSGKIDGGLAVSGQYPVRSILLDHREAGQFGGTGTRSDWNLAVRIKDRYPLILAGGLHAENIREAIHFVAPDAVDINSGVEGAPGQKDPEKIKRIIGIIRSLNHDENVARPQRPFRCFRGPLRCRNADVRTH